MVTHTTPAERDLIAQGGAQCPECGQRMLIADGCRVRALIIDGKAYHRFRCTGEEVTPEGRCHDCGARPGHYHHYGCDMEMCPRCGEQAIGCNCE